MSRTVGTCVTKKFFRINNLKNFLEDSCRRGMVLALRRKPSEISGDVDWGNSTPTRKRLHHEVVSPPSQPPPCPTSSSALIPIISVEDEEVQERARAYARTEGDEDATQQMLLTVGHLSTPQASPPLQIVVATTAVAPEIPDQWVATKMGHTPMYHNAAKNLYKCAYCDRELPTAMGVVTHIGKHCKKKPSQPTEKGEADTIKEEDDEDII